MDHSPPMEASPATEEDYPAAIDHLIRKMDLMKERMDEKQREIERMHAETQVLLSEIKVG